MEYLTLDHGVKMPLVGFGTFQITDGKECEKSVLSAINAGYRLIDTAQAYGNEEFVGNAVKNCGVARDELFITTKLWFRNYEKADAERTLTESLQKLRLDYVDMVLLHWPYGDVYAAWRTLEEFYEAGKIRAIGISNFEADRMIDLITFHKIKPCINQIETHLFCQRKKERGLFFEKEKPGRSKTVASVIAVCGICDCILLCAIVWMGICVYRLPYRNVPAWQ